MKKIIILFVGLLFLTACGAPTQKEKPITPFSFTDQHGNNYGSDQLEGNIWIANFIFTNCKTVCPQMTNEMASLQKQFKDEGVPMEFVSFTVDPSFDTPSVLHTYIQDFTDDFSNWHLLTGYSQEVIEGFARDQFKTIIQKPVTSDQVIHGTNFYLIDKQGRVVNEYNYMDISYADQMIKEARALQN